MKHWIFTFLILSGFSTLGALNVAHAQRFEAALSTGYLGYGKNSTQIDLGPGFFYQPKPAWGWLQLGGEISYQKLSERGGSTHALLFMAGPTFNLNGSVLADAYFVSIGFAYKSGSSDGVDATLEDPNGTGFYLMFGRRITLAPNWSLRPTVGMISTGGSGVIIRPFAVSYVF
jgi:hypothetical protein